MINKQEETVIIGGGTFSHVRNHLSLAAPAFGTTAKKLHKLLGGELILTKMADSNSDIVTNDDLSRCIGSKLLNKRVKTIIFNAAVCDYIGIVNDIPGQTLGPVQREDSDGGKYKDRLKTSEGNKLMRLMPADKIIKDIRIKRPDIFLVGFKTTTNASEEEQFLTALKMMKASKCNLVLANDTVTRLNMIITPEESAYCVTTDRDKALNELSYFVSARNNLTYHKTIFNQEKSRDTNLLTDSFKKVLKYVIDKGGYIENNGNGFTPGHFAQRTQANDPCEDAVLFFSSQRKANHNLVFSEGITLVYYEKDKIIAWGDRKPSVGARSQALMFERYKDYDCIVHTHNPLKADSKIPVVTQKPFQCGSLECGLNTANNLQDFDGIKAVFLEKHGANILFKSSDKPEKIIKFIDENIELGVKIGL